MPYLRHPHTRGEQAPATSVITVVRVDRMSKTSALPPENLVFAVFLLPHALQTRPGTSTGCEAGGPSKDTWGVNDGF